MASTDAGDDLSGKISRLRLDERPVLLDVVEQFAAADVLHRHAQVRVRDEHLLELHDERVAERPVVHDLAAHVIGDFAASLNQLTAYRSDVEV